MFFESMFVDFLTAIYFVTEAIAIGQSSSVYFWLKKLKPPFFLVYLLAIATGATFVIHSNSNSLSAPEQMRFLSSLNYIRP